MLNMEGKIQRERELPKSVSGSQELEG
jgi:hypothetical protein